MLRPPLEAEIARAGRAPVPSAGMEAAESESIPTVRRETNCPADERERDTHRLNGCIFIAADGKHGSLCCRYYGSVVTHSNSRCLLIY